VELRLAEEEIAALRGNKSAAQERRVADPRLSHFIVRTTRNLALPDIIRS
jgi:hypothetical protein